jgi:hypothetical protein
MTDENPWVRRLVTRLLVLATLLSGSADAFV